MWESALASVQHPVAEALLRKRILPSWGSGFEKVSAVLSVRSALQANAKAQTLFFLVPGARDSTARYLTAGLLVGDFAHCQGGSYLPVAEVGHLFKGDLLLVTPAASPAREALEELKLTAHLPLGELWDVDTLSKYRQAKKGTKPRVFVTNPGWATSKSTNWSFGAVVIDASHPRTLGRLSELLQIAERLSSLRIVVSPPLDRATMQSFGYPQSASAWLWDPQSAAKCEELAGSPAKTALQPPDRTLWVCDEDPELDAVLSTAYGRLSDVLREANGNAIPGLHSAWGIINRLRQMSVPLAQLEEEGAKAWMGSLRVRIDALNKVEGHANPLWEVAWPAIVQSVEAAYQTLLKRAEPAKFWVLANRLESWLLEHDDGEVLRIVVGSRHEAKRLSEMLADLVDHALDATADGIVEVVSFAEEAKLVCAGLYARTLLAGPHSAWLRYLDVYPKLPVEELVYPFEAGLEQAAQTRLYKFMGELQDDVNRVAFLKTIGLHTSASATPVPLMPPPRIRALRSSGKPVQLVVSAEVSTALDIEELARSSATTGVEYGEWAPLSGAAGSRFEQAGLVEVRFLEGASRRYPLGFKVDVYFPESEEMQRILAQKLEAGHHVISFVDGEYDDLFRRLREAVYQQLPSDQRIKLELWDEAKRKLIARFRGDRGRLYEALSLDGLESEEAAMSSWFRDEDDVMAPQQAHDFFIVARATQCFPTESMMQKVFACIQQERGRNRKIGRALTALLRAIASGSGYEEALESARRMDASLSDVLSAVELLEVVEVRHFYPNP